MLFRKYVLLFFSILLIQACATGSREDFAIPGCEKAWVAIDKATTLEDLKTLVVNNCSQIYQQGWRIIDRRFSRKENVKPAECQRSFDKLKNAGQLDNVKFMITHNCPVFYRHGWIIPPN